MSSGAAKRLTDRQRAVMERIDRRVPIKVIAQELGVSETRINQHIRALKDVYVAGSLGELVENYRAALAPDPDDRDAGPGLAGVSEAEDDGIDGAADGSERAPFSEPAYIKTQINPATNLAEFGGRDDPGRLVLSDAMPLTVQVPWLRPGEPRVVPAALDGEHAVLIRLGAIVGIASGILAAIVLTVTAAVALSDAMNGRATVTVDQMQAPD